ncbi:MAG TPA: translation initiation factor eIF-2B [Candidatus Fraserbacteria bacterium]|nr:translation initiation factor eIF-2B [Candidatus Fraserbacteria bacterium]
MTWLAAIPAEQSLGKAQQNLSRFTRELAKAKPAMASMRNLANQALLASELVGSPAELRRHVAQTVQRYIQQLGESTDLIAAQAARLIRPGATVMTISYSSVVLATFKRALSAGKHFRVICPESRPICEGRVLAQELARLGLRAELVADAAAPALVSRSELLLLGGDALAPEGLVNKIGSYPLALAAQAAQRPVIALVSRQKYLPLFRRAWLPQEPPQELWPEGEMPAKLTILNSYFEPVPLALLGQVISEAGALAPEQLLGRLQALRLLPILAA